jgi:hypothetical protein
LALRARGLVRGRAAASVVTGVLVAALMGCSGGPDRSTGAGSNLPMWINVFHTVTKDPLSSRGCSAAGCARPTACPAAMRVTRGGTVVACKNPCTAFNTDATCCRGAWAGRAKCVPSRWPVDYTQVFKKAEPFAYSYAFDDSATMSCKGGCNYRVTVGPTPAKGTP